MTKKKEETTSDIVAIGPKEPNFMYYFRLSTGEELITETIDEIDITKTPGKNSIYLLRNPMHMSIIPIESGQYLSLPVPWVSRNVMKGEWFSLFGKSIIGWGLVSDKIKSIYMTTLKMLTALEKEAVSEMNIEQEKQNVLSKAVSKNEIPTYKPEEVTSEVVSKLKSNTEITLDDFTHTFEKMKTKPSN